MEEQKSGGTSDTLDSLSASQSLPKSESGQNLIPSMKYHTAFAFLIPLLIGILGVYAQGRKNIFETNIANIWIFLVNTLFYCFALVADLKYQHHQTNYSQFFGPVAITSGSLSSASIISILVGDVAFVIWAFVPVIVAYQHATALKNAYNLLLQKIKSSAFINMAYDWFKGSSSVEQSELPV